jgi:hypothetical protein
MASLRSWLRRAPQPHQLRIRTADDEERVIKLSDNTRHRWTAAAEAVTNARAVVVECIASDGSILRSQEIEYEGDTGEEVDDGEKSRKAIEKAVRGERIELAAVVSAIASQLNTAFDKGADAANTGQEKLVSLVEVLTTHLSLAITNLHNVSVNLANAIAGGADAGEGQSQNGAALLQLIGTAMARGGADKPEAKPNGAAKPGK